MWSLESKALERSVRRAPAWPTPSTDLCHFSITMIKQCWALKPFGNPPWNFENSLSKYGYIWLSLLYTLLKVGRILIGLQFSLSFLSSFLKKGLTSVDFNTVGHWNLTMSYWSYDAWKKLVFTFCDYLTGISFTWDAFVVSNFSISFNVWSKDVHSKWKFGLSSY